MIIYHNFKKVHFFCVFYQKTIDMDNNFVYYTNQAQQICALNNLSLFQSIHLERRKSMSKLKGYRVMLGLTQQAMADKLNISLQSYNNKETKKTPFNDKERLAIKSMVAEIKPDITIDELFYQD